MQRPEVEQLLGKALVTLKIDTDRMIGGADVLKAARVAQGLKETGGIPWFEILSPTGEVLATCEGPGGNIGCPYKDEEIAHFIAMLEMAKSALTAEERETLRKSLVAMREENEARRKAEKQR